MKYTAQIHWAKQTQESFVDNQYSRVHQWSLDGGSTIPMSSSPQVVPIPMSDESLPDPEETFIASIASCHMLFFLFFAAQQKYIVTTYVDNPEGIMQKNETGKQSITDIQLKPKVSFEGEKIPGIEQIQALHSLAHQNCFLANSVKSSIQIYPK